MPILRRATEGKNDLPSVNANSHKKHDLVIARNLASALVFHSFLRHTDIIIINALIFKTYNTDYSWLVYKLQGNVFKS